MQHANLARGVGRRTNRSASMLSLQTLMREEGFVLIGNSADGHFPATSYNVYTKVGKRFYCLDLGGMTESRGGTKGGKVYPTVAALPAERSDFAIVWAGPASAVKAVEAAHEAGCKRIWFSFQTMSPEAVVRARELGLEVVEIGRCPVMYIESDKLPMGCKMHIGGTKVSGTWGRPPQVDETAKRRELL
jgi:predicted CoA-binding protein